MVSIKMYYDIKEMHLIYYVINLAKELCFEGKPVTRELRLYLSMFRFELASVYPELLKKLVSTLQGKFGDLIKAIP